MFDLLLRLLTLILYLIWQVYWKVTERKADREKRKTKSISFVSFMMRSLTFLPGVVLVVQLFGILLFPFSRYALEIQFIGFLFVVIGFIISVKARIDLGTNWAHAAEFQIKREHELVSGGIYRFIRHPIYTGIVIAFFGGELVAKSWLSLFFFVGMSLSVYLQGKREEKILLAHFGTRYSLYMKRTKMFIPFLI